MKKIAVIPARGGSKRLKKKNILAFNGKPMICHSVDAAKECGLFDKIVVSTDDPKIMDAVSDSGCNVDARKKDLAADTARVVDVISDLIQRLENRDESFDYICCLYATSPLRRKSDITGSFDLMMTSKADYCISVTDFEVSPFFAFDINDDSFIQRRWPDEALMPPWKKPPVVVDNGSIYWAKTEKFLETGELTGENCVGYKMPRRQSVDIDTMTDFKLAQFYAKEMDRG